LWPASPRSREIIASAAAIQSLICSVKPGQNAAFERFGLAEVARSEHELESVLRHVTRERQAPDSSFASLPSIASRALSVRPRVKPQPVWRLRVERTAAAVSLAALLIVLTLAAIHWESPYQVVAQPIQSRVHIGTEEEPPIRPVP
jgi:hypothetical protein